MSAGDQYTLGYRQAEQQRLQRQARELAGEANQLFDRVGIGPGDRVLEIGCGPVGCLELLSERVGPTGSVVGIEISPDSVALATQFVSERRLSNVEVVCADCRTSGLPPGSFDHVTARLVLVNVPNPEEIVAEAVALAKPGGTVAFHEVDWAGMICEPPSEEWTTIIDLILAISAKAGTSFYVGRKLPRLLRHAGLEDVGAQPILHYHPAGDPRRDLMLIFADNFKDRIISQGRLSEQEFNTVRQGLADVINDPDNQIYIGPYIQSWGRKPR